jgi:VCBS repeat-containing protein
VANGSSSKQGTYGTLSVNTSTGAYTFAANDAAIEGIKANASETFAVTVADSKATANANLSVNLTGANDAPSGAVTISGTIQFNGACTRVG